MTDFSRGGGGGTDSPFIAPSNPALLNIQRFNADGTYTPTPGTRRALVYVTAGGGAGGGVPAGAAEAYADGGAGGGTRVGMYVIDESLTGNVVVGLGGVGVPGMAGNAGNPSSFTFDGVAMTATPGGGGAAGADIATAFYGDYVAAGSGSGGPANAYTIVGEPGGPAIYSTVPERGAPGRGGASHWGPGGAIRGINGGVETIAGLPGVDGAGGSGAGSTGSLLEAGGAGGDGVVLIFEYG